MLQKRDGKPDILCNVVNFAMDVHPLRRDYSSN